MELSEYELLCFIIAKISSLSLVILCTMTSDLIVSRAVHIERR